MEEPAAMTGGAVRSGWIVDYLEVIQIERML